jgi:glutamine cyclotransferase
MFLLCVIAVSLLLQVACSDDVSSSGPPPTCTIVSPEDGASYEFGDTVEIAVDAADASGGRVTVKFYINGTEWGDDDKPPYEYTLKGIPYKLGDHTITAVAVDEKDAETADTVGVSISSDMTPIYGVEVKDSYPHDPAAFTQGLIAEGDYFYEGTGLNGQSTIRKVEIETGEVVMRRDIPDMYFGEGITLMGPTLFQLTWRRHVGFVYSVADFDSIGSFDYEGEGWGLTHDGTRLMMSDGTPYIRVMDPNSFDVLREFEVADSGQPVTWLNELEYVEGDLFANIYYNTRIARISAEDGSVIGWIDCREIYRNHNRDGVLNGIAYDDFSKALYITGKNWDKVYKIELTH